MDITGLLIMLILMGITIAYMYSRAQKMKELAREMYSERTSKGEPSFQSLEDMVKELREKAGRGAITVRPSSSASSESSTHTASMEIRDEEETSAEIIPEQSQHHSLEEEDSKGMRAGERVSLMDNEALSDSYEKAPPDYKSGKSIFNWVHGNVDPAAMVICHTILEKPEERWRRLAEEL